MKFCVSNYESLFNTVNFSNCLIGTILLLSSCLSLNDRREDLGDGYKFHEDGGRSQIHDSQTYNNTDIYSGIVDYRYNDQFIIVKQRPNLEHFKLFTRAEYSIRFGIYSSHLANPNSIELSKGIDTLLERRIKADSSFYKHLKDRGVTDKNSFSDWQIIDSILDSLFKTDPHYAQMFELDLNFWIIDKDNHLKHGPMTKDDFDDQNSILSTKLNFEK